MATSGADIQVENGNFSRIHNAILEAIYGGDFSLREVKCLLFLIRQTYGFQRKSDTISYEQFADATGINRRHVISTMQSLIAKNVVTSVSSGTRRPQTWAFNKYIERWNLVTESVTNLVTKTVTTTSDQNSHQIEVLVTKTVTTTSDQNSHQSSDQNSHPQKKERNGKEMVHTNGNAPKPKAERSEKQKNVDAWVEAFAFALEGDTALRSVANMYRGWVKEFESAGYVPEDVRVWKETRWPLDWRFEKGQKPSRGALTAGLPEVRQRRERQEAKAKPTPPKMMGIVNIDGKRMQILKYADGREELKEIVEVIA